LIAIKDQARDIDYLKAHPLVKSKLKNWPSVRRSPLLCLQLKFALFRLLQWCQFKRNQLLHQPTLQHVLLSSQSNKILKVDLLIAINFDDGEFSVSWWDLGANCERKNPNDSVTSRPRVKDRSKATTCPRLSSCAASPNLDHAK